MWYRNLSATDIERASGGVLDDDLRRGKRLVRRAVLGIVLLVTGLMIFTVALIESATKLQGQL